MRIWKRKTDSTNKFFHIHIRISTVSNSLLAFILPNIYTNVPTYAKTYNSLRYAAQYQKDFLIPIIHIILPIQENWIIYFHIHSVLNQLN